MKDRQVEQTNSEREISNSIERVASRLKECNPDIARAVFETKFLIEMYDQSSSSFFSMDDINYDQLQAFKRTYESMDAKLLDLVDKFVHECKCSK